MFSRGFGSRDTPRTFAACARVWNDKAVAVKRYDRVKLGEKTYLYKGDGRYYAAFHDNILVRYYPEYKTIHGCGWEGSPTTRGRIAALTGVSMRRNSRLGYKEPVRVGGHPYFDSMRIDNYGYVFAEDQRPDYKEVVKKAVVQKYANLFRKIGKMTRGRWELGEWKERAHSIRDAGNFEFIALLRIERSIAAGETFLSAEDVAELFGVYSTLTDHTAFIAALRDGLRHQYYCANNGFETIEVK
jgi:hypothetical protein